MRTKHWILLSSISLIVGIMGTKGVKAVIQAVFGPRESRVEADRSFNEVKSAEIVGKVIAAFDALTESNPGIIARFQQAFNERATIPELKESKGKDGLSYVLADLLWGPVPEYCFFEEKHVFDSSAPITAEFQSQFHKALQRVAVQYPHVLPSMMQYRDSSNRSYDEILKAVLIIYADNKKVLPF